MCLCLRGQSDRERERKTKRVLVVSISRVSYLSTLSTSHTFSMTILFRRGHNSFDHPMTSINNFHCSCEKRKRARLISSVCVSLRRKQGHSCVCLERDPETVLSVCLHVMAHVHLDVSHFEVHTVLFT